MHSVQLSIISQFGQITPDGLWGDPEMLNQPLNRDLPFATGNANDLLFT
jgi:hypothetical protein